MYLTLLKLFLITIWVNTLNGLDCNLCDVSTGFACFSQNQYFACNANGEFDLSTLFTCSTGVCDSSLTISPCSADTPPSCAVESIVTQAPSTTTELVTDPITTTTSVESSTTTTSVESSTTTMNVESSTLISTESTTITITTQTPFNATNFCTAKSTVGRYSHPEDTTCKMYVYCYQNGGIKGAEYSCQGSTLFDEVKQSCMSNITCSSSETTSELLTEQSTTLSTTESTTTTTLPITDTTTEITVFDANSWCENKSVSRFAHPTEKTCTLYVYCYLNGIMKGAVYTCPGTTLFEPATQSCKLDYTCPSN